MKSITVFQNYITDSDKASLDPAFIPYDWRHNPHPELREIAIFFDIFDKGRYREADYTGLFSKRFGEKTNIAGSQLIQFIESNPGYDVYFINPHHYFKMYSYNIWDHGELCHSGIIDLTQKLFVKAGIDIKIDRYERENEKTLLYCNYWVGSQSFWEHYIPFLKHLFNTILSMPPQECGAYFSNTSYTRGDTPFFPFIFERLFSTYIRWNKQIKTLSYPYTLQEAWRTQMTATEQKIFSSAHSLFEKYENHHPDFIRELVTQWRNFMFGLQKEP